MTDSQALPPPSPLAPPPPNPPRRLRRTSNKAEGRKWLGVASGLAEYLGLSTSAVRWGFVLSCAAGGLGIITYLVAAVLIPADNQADPLGVRISAGRPDRLLAIIAGVALLAFAVLNANSLDLVAAALLACAGVYLWSTSRGGSGPLGRPENVPTAAPWAPPRADGSWSTQAATSTPFAAAAPARPVLAGPRRSWGWATLASALAAMVLSAPFASAVMVLTIGVAVLLVGLAAGLFSGRRRMWLLILPILFLGSLIPLARWFGVAGVPVNAGAGEVLIGSSDVGVGAADPAHGRTELAAGHLRVNLRQVVSNEQLRFALGTGQLDLEVPSDVAVTLHAKVGFGKIQIDRQSTATSSESTVSIDINGSFLQGGTDVEVTRSIGPANAARHLDVDARVGIGEIRVIPTAPESGSK